MAEGRGGAAAGAAGADVGADPPAGADGGLLAQACSRPISTAQGSQGERGVTRPC